MGSRSGWDAGGGIAVGLHEGAGEPRKEEKGENVQNDTERLVDVYGCRAGTPHLTSASWLKSFNFFLSSPSV